MDITKTIIFPGTFNPIHNGHLELAEKVRKITGAEKVIFVPAYSPYHKNTNDSTTAQNRLEMTKLAVQENPHFEVSDIEFQMKQKKSYTINTITEILKKLENSDSQLYQKVNLIIGADAFEKLDSWYKIKELSGLVKFLVVTRPGNKSLAEIRKTLLTDTIDYQPIEESLDISSTRVRENIKNGKDITGLVPKSVADYIKEHKLYGVY